MIIQKLFTFFLIIFVTACTKKPLNNPYLTTDSAANIYYTSFAEQPKTLDPARSYSADESTFVAQIYEPPLQYHYLKRPYTLIPLTASQMPKEIFLDKNGKTLPEKTSLKNIAYTVYEIHIKPGIYYQPHPAFVKLANGQYEYLNLKKEELKKVNDLSYFQHTATRELTAEDYVYEIKRLADPSIQSPVFGFLSNYIVGFKTFNQQLLQLKQTHLHFLDLRQLPLSGVQTIDKYTYRIMIKGYYPQFLYWLAMPFFAPIPWEADAFYSQAELSQKNINFNWYPVGTGPYLLQENNPNRRMVLVRNPNFHLETYPTEGMPSDAEQGLLIHAGQRLPFIDKIIFTLEKESIPRWTKFLQGYYDQSAISSDSFDQAIKIDSQGKTIVSDQLAGKGIRLQTSITPGFFYIGFNMLDPIVGGYDEHARKLRLAISIALDYEEFIAIFLNDRGIAAHSPIPPGIFGYRHGQAGTNHYIYDWNNDHAERKKIDEAKKLLQAARYENGRDPETGKALILNYDVPSGGTGDDKAVFAWMRKQFAKLGISLQIRDTQYNRFQEKVRQGQAQLFFWGWTADYPEPENFLFLLYGPNGKVKFGGENASNYQNKNYDELFIKMRNLPNSEARQAIIDKMIVIAQQDAPWIWGFYPQSFTLSQSWVDITKPNAVANNTLKYVWINPALRAIKRAEWNMPIWWPLWLGIILFLVSLIPVGIYYWRQNYKITLVNCKRIT